MMLTLALAFHGRPIDLVCVMVKQRSDVIDCIVASCQKILRTSLEDIFGKDPKTYDGRDDGESCLFSVVLPQMGDRFSTLSLQRRVHGDLVVCGPQDRRSINGWMDALERCPLPPMVCRDVL